MAKMEVVRYAFNRGLISPLAMTRVDLKRAALSAEIQENWMPRTLGAMMLRPGMQYIANTAGPCRYVEFIRSLTATYLLEFAAAYLRIVANDAVIKRVLVVSPVINPDFGANLNNWTDNDEAGGVSAWVAGGYMGLTGNGSAAAIRDQVVATDSPNVEHGLHVIVARGPVTLRVGSAAGLDEYINEVTLLTGSHSLAFTPTAANYNIRFMSRLDRQVLVDDCRVEAAGPVLLASPYGAADLDNIRANTESLSVDVMFVGCTGYQQRRIERRASGRSWSIVLYQPEDGPFRAPNTGPGTMTPSVLNGNGTLTSSLPFFATGHAGALFRLGSTGQTVVKAMALVNDATNSIRVVGILTDRTITISLVGITVGRTVILEYSTDNLVWIAVAGKSWTADTVEGYTDGLNNQIIYYRLRCSVVGAAGNTAATLSIPTGTIVGTCRAAAYVSTTVMNIEVLADFGATTATTDWVEGLWSDKRGWPSSCTLYEGRLVWGGFDACNGSVTDAFDSFEPQTIGDSGPWNRTIGSGPMDNINWILPLQRMVLGAALSEHSVRSNAFDEPITPTNFNRKQCSTQGSAPVQAVKIDSRGAFVQRGGTRLFELAFDPETYDYGAKDMTLLCPDVCKPRVVRMAVQRRPDTRIHCVLSDGTAAVQVYDHAEQVNCWIKVTTFGEVLDVVVLPGASGVEEDNVYYHTHRTIGGVSEYMLEKWALEGDCQGGTLNKQADAFAIVGSGGPMVSVPHLLNQQVILWANGKDLGTYMTDAAGNFQASEAIPPGAGICGLYYEAKFKSSKLGDTLSNQKNIDQVAPILHNTHARGLFIGQDFNVMDNLPLMYHGTAVNADLVYPTYDEQDQEFPGLWDSDSRLCLKAIAPRPCTVLAVTVRGQAV